MEQGRFHEVKQEQELLKRRISLYKKNSSTAAALGSAANDRLQGEVQPPANPEEPPAVNQRSKEEPGESSSSEGDSSSSESDSKELPGVEPEIDQKDL